VLLSGSGEQGHILDKMCVRVQKKKEKHHKIFNSFAFRFENVDADKQRHRSPLLRFCTTLEQA
jgi:hypothetical protein